MEFENVPEFDKDLKRLLKLYNSLNTDIENLKQILNIFPNERAPFSFRINNLQTATKVIKIKKIACSSLKGKGVNSGLRIIYTYSSFSNTIIFIELYHKNEKANENRERILKYLK